MKFKPSAIVAALFFSTLGISAGANAATGGQQMVNPNAGVVVGYWHNWCGGAGYKGGLAPCVDLQSVNPMYNVVDVSFMKVYDTAAGRIPTFHLDPQIGLSESEFIAQIAELNNQGRAVLLALGGADAHIELKTGDEQAFADEIIRLTDRFGFDGLDIDLEQEAVTAANNQTVIPAALRMVKDHYAAQGKNFLITMAPEFPYLTAGGKYLPYIQALEGYYDWINPQFYNQGGDGVYVDNVGWIAQNNDTLKKEFIFYIADSLVNGSRGFYKIPHDKLVFGIPSSNDAAATGFVTKPQALYDAFAQLRAQGQPLRGVMTWSINWDMGQDAAGNHYNEQFIKDYGPFIHGQTPPPPAAGKPVFTGLTDTRVRHGSQFDALAGIAATDKEDGNLTSHIIVEGHVDTGRIGTYLLAYSVVDSDGNETKASRSVEVFSQLPEFKGVLDENLTLGASFDPLAGVSAIDAEDGNLTAQIKVTGTVDTQRVGQYTLTYSVTDSAAQTVTLTRTIKVTDGSSCATAWDANAVYNGGESVSHKGKTWQAQWWTRGEEPGTTGAFGVWREQGDSDCGNTGQPALPEITLAGIATSYQINQGSVTLRFTLNTNALMDVSTLVTGDFAVTGGEQHFQVNGNKNIELTLNKVFAGQYQITVTAHAEDGTQVTKTVPFSATEQNVTPEPGQHPDYVAGTNYQAGDIVKGTDSNLYQCKPWPYSAWCASGAYAPASSQYWADAWNKL